MSKTRALTLALSLLASGVLLLPSGHAEPIVETTRCAVVPSTSLAQGFTACAGVWADPGDGGAPDLFSCDPAKTGNLGCCWWRDIDHSGTVSEGDKGVCVSVSVL